MRIYKKLCFMAALVAFLLCPANVVRAIDAGRGIHMMEFIDGEGNVRSGPGIGHKILFQPATGTQCLIVSEKGPWKEVKFDDGSTGWAHLKNLKAVETSPGDRSDPSADNTNESVVPAMTGGADSYALNAVVLRQLAGMELDDVRRSFSCAGGDVYEIRLANDDRAILCTPRGRFFGKKTFSLRVKTAGLHDVPSKEKKETAHRTVIVYEAVD